MESELRIPRAPSIRRVAVIGAGLMGHGIAQEFALAGYQVSLHDIDAERLAQAPRQTEANLRRLEEMTGAAPAPGVLDRIALSTDLREAVADADVAIEAVFEDLPLKQRLFMELDALCPAAVILASNSSSLLPSAIAADTRLPERVLVAHWVNPPYLIPLVEIVRGPETADSAVAAMFALLQSTGKQPVVVQREVPGFLINRLQVALVREALWLVQEGIATPEDIDTVVRTSLGRRWAVAGPFEVLDLAGWDMAARVIAQILPSLAISPEVPPILRELVERGDFGVKTGRGFHEWTPQAADALRQRLAHALIETGRWATSE